MLGPDPDPVPSPAPDSALDPAPDEPVLRLRDVVKTYGGRRILDGLDLDVHVGEVVALVGPNGVGKSTVLRIASGTEPPDAGSAELDGRLVDDRRADHRRALAVVLDDPAHLPDLTVTEHLDLVARAHGVLDPAARVASALETVGIPHVADLVPAVLSSGQRHRLALASTLVRPARVVLLDEPEQRLDAAGRQWLGDHLRGLATDGVAVLIASHDADLLDRVGVRRVELTAAA